MDETGEIEKFTPKPKEGKFEIVSPQEKDSLGTTKWKEYLDKERLLEAWNPPERSLFKRFQKTKTIDSINQWAGELRPRYSRGEKNSEKGIENLIKSGILGRDTAVILDSGGAHSVAMAVKLVEQGYQPVVMFDGIPHPKGANRSEQELATLLYFAEQMNRLKQEGKIKPEAPPVFILDAHRDDKLIGEKQKREKVDNTYTYQKTDFPSAKELRQQGITKIVYLNEGDQNGEIHQSYQSPDRLGRDLKPIAMEWEKNGIKLIYTGVSPWEANRYDFGGLERAFLESRLSYPDMSPEVYGDGNGIAMHINRERFIFTNKDELMAINERGFARDMTPEEIAHFRGEIERQISSQPDNQTLRKLYNRFPK